MVAPNNETIEIDVIINTQIANRNLKATLNQVKELESVIKKLSASSGASFGQVGQYLKNLYASQVQLSGASKETQVALKAAFGQDVNNAIKNINQGIKESEQSGKGFNQVLNLIRGTLVAIGVFRVFQFIEESIRKATETAQEFETSLYRLQNVERILSQSGIETSVQSLRDGIKEIKEQLPIFSEADITQQVSLIGIMTKDLGVTEQQIVDIAKAIGVLNIRSGETEDLLTTTNKVLTALVAPSGRGIASLGLDFSEANIKATAFKNGILEASESFSDLTDHEKDMLKIAILLEGTGQELETVQKFLETNTGILAEQSAEWEDFLRIVGQAILPVKGIVKGIWIPLIQVSSRNLRLLMAGFVNLAAIVTATGTIIYNVFRGNLSSIREFNEIFSAIRSDLTERFFPEVAAEKIDEATGSIEDFAEEVQSLEELEGFDKLQKDLEKLQEKIEETRAEFAQDWNMDLALGPLGREIEDFNIEMDRIREDYAIKRKRIDEDANDKIADANKKHRQNEIDEEARFQEQLRQLREKFLFNLEDALRERDARQVLRLQRQYQMDKTALENEYALRQKAADEQHQNEIDRIKRERDDRLAELAEEERIKLQREREDFELKQARAAEDHAIEMERLKQEISDRLMEFAQAIGEEYNLNEEGVNALYDLLQQYYGPNGYFEGLYDYSYKSMVAKAQAMLQQVNALIGQAQASILSANMLNPISSTFYNSDRDLLNIGPQANGGTYFANKPTIAMFGEAGPEFASFTPVRKMSGASGAGSLPAQNGNGKVDIELWLSPDLEARVVNTALTETANAVVRVKRTK